MASSSMDGNNKKNFIAKDIAYIAIFAAILFAQEELLTFVPNVQLTVFLLVLYSKKLGFVRTSIIVVIHVILDNLIMSSFNPIFTPFMLIGWLLIPIFITTIFKKIESPILLAIAAAILSFFYCWCFFIPNIFILKMDIKSYFLADITFELILALCSFLTTLILYKPCSMLFDKFGITNGTYQKNVKNTELEIDKKFEDTKAKTEDEKEESDEELKDEDTIDKEEQ